MPTLTFSRRQALIAGAAAPLAVGLAGPVRAAAPMLGASTPTYYRFGFGDFEITTLLAASRTMDGLHSIFGLNASEAEFTALSEANNIPPGTGQGFFTPTLINTGSELVLFDTGLSPDGITAALAAAGYTPDQVDKVVITHMHGDHIGGLSAEGTPTFANASYMTGAREYDHWAGTDNQGFAGKVKPLAEQMTFLAGGDSPASGITAVEAFGHTPGHMAYMVESGGKSLLLAADFANHYVLSLARPDWEVKYDIDKAQAAQTRKTLLDMLAADKVPFVGYHMPFPAVGYVETTDDGYRYVASSYQMML